VNYDLLKNEATRLNGINWSGVTLDEAHFIKNASARTMHCLKLLGVQDNAKAALIGPSHVFLMTGTPMTSRPRDLFNLLGCVGHPATRSFLSFAKPYCEAYRNDFGWVTTGASNLEELNRLMKEVTLRRRKDEVLDLPPKVRSWVPVDISSAAAALNAVEAFLLWTPAAGFLLPPCHLTLMKSPSAGSKSYHGWWPHGRHVGRRAPADLYQVVANRRADEGVDPKGGGARNRPFLAVSFHEPFVRRFEDLPSDGPSSTRVCVRVG
jgi:hypothetical protein